MTGTTVSPEQILKELSELWVSLAKPGHLETGGGVLRACTMTLMVLAEMTDDAGALGQTMATLMPEHPARAIMVRLQSGAEGDLSARVFSQCWLPFGQRRQICCEQIEITAPDQAIPDLPAVLLPLAASDLPLIVWCRSARLARMAEFSKIARAARKVIFDSAQLGETPGDTMSALERVQDAVRNGVIVGDLAWTRLTRRREMLAQVFENRQYLAQLPRVTEVRVEHAGGQEISARYLGAWLSDALAAAGAHPALTIAAGERLSVILTGGDLHLQQSCSDGTLTVTVDGLSQCTNLPRPTDYLLLREELGILRRDPVFETALATAARLAYPNGK
jgi:glucose-6-phosphate dehydrogenase assembly protein OpcA